MKTNDPGHVLNPTVRVRVVHVATVEAGKDLIKKGKS